MAQWWGMGGPIGGHNELASLEEWGGHDIWLPGRDRVGVMTSTQIRVHCPSKVAYHNIQD